MGDIGLRTIAWACALLLGVAVAGPSWSMGGAPPPGGMRLDEDARREWAAVLQEAEASGVHIPRVEATVARMRASGLTPEQGQELLAPVFRAAREGLPPKVLFTKVDEGLIKGADPGAILRAVERRAAVLRRAADLLRSRQVPVPPAGSGRLVGAVAMALESGVPEEAIGPVLDRGRDEPPGRVAAVIEAGEAMFLSGVDPETVRHIMEDCLARRLRRPEIIRVARFVREQRSRGMDGPAIRKLLWGGRETEGSGPGRAGRWLRGGPGGGGDGAGPGRGRHRGGR